MKFIKIVYLTILFVCGSNVVLGQSDFDPEYVKVTNERAQKIVDELDLNNEEEELRVRNLIAEQYRSLSRIQDGRDDKIAEVKSSDLKEEKKEMKIGKLEKKADKSIAKLHTSYLEKLSEALDYDQIVKVKDGMTYGVLPLTYNGYLDMLPDLTEEQKKMIFENLVEAREHAMDGGSSDEKHWWFGKYKGKINNFLSADGYDLKKASKDWQKRLAEAKK